MNKKKKNNKHGAKSEGIIAAIFGKNTPPLGRSPAVALWNPKFAHNVGTALRACSCFGIKQLWFSGDRVEIDLGGKKRLPREERMRGYRDVELRQFDTFFDQFDNAVPVAIELRDSAELLPDFQHPNNALYVFGPEDGSLPGVALGHCHRFVVIPTHHCTNLAAAVYIVLYDRLVKRIAEGKEEKRTLKEFLHEHRGFVQAGDDVAWQKGIRETRC